MAVAKHDKVTAQLPGMPKKRGRPPTGKAKTAAQRVAEYRARQAAAAPVERVVVINPLVAFALAHHEKHMAANLNLSALLDAALRKQLVQFGYSFAHEDKGEVCYGSAGVING